MTEQDSRVPVSISRRGLRDLHALPIDLRRRVGDAIDRLEAGDPRVDLQQLRGAGALWRIRVGDYRIIVERHRQPREWHILRVLHRREAYR